MNPASLVAPTLGLLSNTPHSHGPFSVFRKTGQGAGAGVLGLSGAGAFGETQAAATAPPMDWSSLDGLANSLASGAFSGPLQLLAAALVFLAAGRCIARMLGLALVTAGFIAWREGVRLEDVTPILDSLWVRVSAAAAAFVNPPVAA